MWRAVRGLIRVACHMSRGMSTLFQSRHCQRCGSVLGPIDLLCPACGSGESTTGSVRPDRVVNTRTLPLPWPWDGLASYPEGSAISLTGGPGSGKSTIAAVLASAGPDVKWITTEQTIVQVSSFFRRLSLPVPDIAACSTTANVRDAIRATVRGVLVLDSLTQAGGWTEQATLLHQIRDWAHAAPERWAVTIVQINGQGEAAGLMELPHMVEATCIVGADQMSGLRTLSATKNRNGPLFSRLFGIGPGGLEHLQTLAEAASYSVEGSPGAYRLHQWPYPGAKWAGILDAIHPDVGYASAAIVAPSYRRGVLEPADVRERQAYAEAHGLAWLHPSPALLAPKPAAKPKPTRARKQRKQ